MSCGSISKTEAPLVQINKMACDEKSYDYLIQNSKYFCRCSAFYFLSFQQTLSADSPDRKDSNQAKREAE